MNKIFLGKLQQKVGAQTNVEIDITLCGFGLGNVQIEGLVKEFNGLLLVLFVPPADDCLEVCVIGSFFVVFTYFNEEFKLLTGILQLILFDLTVNHSIKWCLVCLIKRNGLLIYLICSIEIIQHTFLISNFRMVISIFRCQHHSYVKHLECLFKNGFAPSAIASEQSRHIVKQVCVTALILLHRAN